MISGSSIQDEEPLRVVKKVKKTVVKASLAEGSFETAPATSKIKSESRPLKKPKESSGVKKVVVIDDSRREEIRRQMLGDRMPERRADRPVERRPVVNQLKKDKPGVNDQKRALSDESAGSKEAPIKKKKLIKRRPVDDQMEYVPAPKEGTPKKSVDKVSNALVATEKVNEDGPEMKLDVPATSEESSEEVAADAMQIAPTIDVPPMQIQDAPTPINAAASDSVEKLEESALAPKAAALDDPVLKAENESTKAIKSPATPSSSKEIHHVSESPSKSVDTPKSKGRRLVKKSELVKSPTNSAVKNSDSTASPSKSVPEVDDESSAASLNPAEDPMMSNFRNLLCQRDGKSRGLAYNLKYGEKLQVFWEGLWWHAIAVLYAYDDDGELYLKVHFSQWPESDDHYLNVKDGHLLIRNSTHKLKDTGPKSNKTKFQFSLSRDNARSHYGIQEGEQYVSAKKFKYLLTPLMEEPNMLYPLKD